MRRFSLLAAGGVWGGGGPNQQQLVDAAENVRSDREGDERWTVDAVFIFAITLK